MREGAASKLDECGDKTSRDRQRLSQDNTDMYRVKEERQKMVIQFIYHFMIYYYTMYDKFVYLELNYILEVVMYLDLLSKVSLKLSVR